MPDPVNRKTSTDNARTTVQHGNASVCPEDLWLLSKLSATPGVSEDLLDELVEWWQQEAESNNLIAFLAGEKAISLSMAQTLGEMAEGTLNRAIEEVGFAPHDIAELRQTLRKHRQEVVAATAAAASSPTVVAADLPRTKTRGKVSVGDMLGKCKLTRILGRGGTCTVFAAQHQSLNITVAVKVFNTAKAGGRDFNYDIFRKEAQTVAQLNGPYMVRILDFEEADPPYMILEYVDGMSALELIKQSGSVDSQQAVQIIERVAKALDYAHANDVIHRDIKPANIMIDRTGRVKLTDLGLAGMTSVLEQLGADVGRQMLCGTPAYIAPEAATDPAAADERSDIYSLGATLYHMLTGKYPFEATNVEMMILKHVRTPLEPPHTRCPELNRRLSQLVCDMMHKDPEDRVQTAKIVQERIAEIAQARDYHKQGGSVTTRLRRRLLSMFTGNDDN